MEFQLNTSYKILIEVNNQVLTYKCVFTDEDEQFITFTDDRGKEWNYNKRYVISATKLDYKISTGNGSKND